MTAVALPTIEVIPKPQDDPDLARSVAIFTLREHLGHEPQADDIAYMVSNMERTTSVAAFDSDGAIIATAGLRRTLRPHDGLLVDVATHMDQRRQGLGRRVVEAVEDIARAEGISHIDVFPLGGSVPFYEGLGYVENTHCWEKEL